MLRPALTAAAALFATLANANEYGTVVFGNYSHSPQYQQPILDAASHPNVSSTVTFLRTFNHTEETWTWTLNLSDVAVPNDDRAWQLDDYSEGLRLASTGWSIQPPGGETSLVSYLKINQRSVMTFWAQTLRIPANVSANYDGTGNCSALLGADCYKSMQQHIDDGVSTVLDLPGCEGTLSLGVSTGRFGHDIMSNDTFPYYSNASVCTVESPVGASGNLTHFKDAETMLQILTMGFKYAPGTGGESPSIVCQIIKKEAETSAAVSWRGTSTGLLWGFVVLCALALMR